MMDTMDEDDNHSLLDLNEWLDFPDDEKHLWDGRRYTRVVNDSPAVEESTRNLSNEVRAHEHDGECPPITNESEKSRAERKESTQPDMFDYNEQAISIFPDVVDVTDSKQHKPPNDTIEWTESEYDEFERWISESIDADKHLMHSDTTRLHVDGNQDVNGAVARVDVDIDVTARKFEQLKRRLHDIDVNLEESDSDRETPGPVKKSKSVQILDVANNCSSSTVVTKAEHRPMPTKCGHISCPASNAELYFTPEICHLIHDRTYKIENGEIVDCKVVHVSCSHSFVVVPKSLLEKHDKHIKQLAKLNRAPKLKNRTNKSTKRFVMTDPMDIILARHHDDDQWQRAVVLDACQVLIVGTMCVVPFDWNFKSAPEYETDGLWGKWCTIACTLKDNLTDEQFFKQFSCGSEVRLQFVGIDGPRRVVTLLEHSNVANRTL